MNDIVIDATIRTEMLEAGYADEFITDGLAYADTMGASGIIDRGSLVLSRMLYSPTELADGVRANWTPSTP